MIIFFSKNKKIKKQQYVNKLPLFLNIIFPKYSNIKVAKHFSKMKIL